MHVRMALQMVTYLSQLKMMNVFKRIDGIMLGTFTKMENGRMIFQITAFIILAVFYGCYMIKMMSQRKKGIQTDQMGKAKEGLAKYIEVVMKVVTYLVPIAEVVAICLNISAFPIWVRLTGMVIAVLGLAVFIAAVLTMRDSWRAGVSKTDKTELVTAGIFQISRNPAFLGFDLVYIGILLMFFHWWLFALSAFAGLMFHLQIINNEEDFLMETFGENYLAYKKKVNRYLGRR